MFAWIISIGQVFEECAKKHLVASMLLFSNKYADSCLLAQNPIKPLPRCSLHNFRALLNRILSSLPPPPLFVVWTSCQHPNSLGRLRSNEPRFEAHFFNPLLLLLVVTGCHPLCRALMQQLTTSSLLRVCIFVVGSRVR